jgi:hypothetical protein
MTSRTLSYDIPPSPSSAIDGTLQSRLEESERSREWWKHRVSVLDLRCREINSQLRDILAENKRYPPIQNVDSRLKVENERLVTETLLYRMRFIAEHSLRKIDSLPSPSIQPHTPPLSPRQIQPHSPPRSPSWRLNGSSPLR